MPIITVSRTYGSGGAPLGRELARRFDAEFLDRSIVASVAERSGIPEDEAEGYDERLPSVWQRLAAALASGSPEVAMPPLPADVLPATAVHERLAQVTRAVILEAAERGNCVIVGRGAAFIIGRRPDALHLQLHAALDIRVRNFMTRVEELPPDVRPDEDSLRGLCRTIDARRAAYVRRLFDVDWLDVGNYDLAIDTGRIPLAVATDLVEVAVRRRSSVSDLAVPASA